MAELLQELNGIVLSPATLMFAAMFWRHDNRLTKIETKLEKIEQALVIKEKNKDNG